MPAVLFLACSIPASVGVRAEVVSLRDSRSLVAHVHGWRSCSCVPGLRRPAEAGRSWGRMFPGQRSPGDPGPSNVVVVPMYIGMAVGRAGLDSLFTARVAAGLGGPCPADVGDSMMGPQK